MPPTVVLKQTAKHLNIFYEPDLYRHYFSMKQYNYLFLVGLWYIVSSCSSSPEQRLTTPWTNDVDHEQPLPEYPRPALVRDQWENLNGQWDYCILPARKEQPTRWDGKITVPYPVESVLSGVERRVGKDSVLWYHRTFTVGKPPIGKRRILHFGASDWRTEVFLNGKHVGTHNGGYTCFSFDITPYLQGEEETLMVKVWDPTDDGKQARGKQVKKPGGIYYTPVTGIWQTVWMEEVPETHIASYQIETDIDKKQVDIRPALIQTTPDDRLQLHVSFGGKTVLDSVFADQEALHFSVEQAQLWSPDTPSLYDFKLAIVRNEQTIDEIKGYFGMRKIEVMPDEQGVYRIFLNHQALFQYGPLDQGYWPDGIYTAPTEAALLWDIQTMKNMGFNMVRKHVKVEPQRWYYHCDRLGLIVWQDMPSGYGEIVPVKDHDHSIDSTWLAQHYEDVQRTNEEEALFRNEWADIIHQLINHPSIGVWVPFNESWGQFKTNELLAWTKTLDPSRIVDGPSGWIDRGAGEMRDYHLYGDRLKALPLEKNRALVIGEFGGLGYAVANHTYAPDAWSYQAFKNPADLQQAYTGLIAKISDLKHHGFAAAIYTQLTDVETEVNGLITYDRKQVKIASDTLKRLHQKLIQ